MKFLVCAILICMCPPLAIIIIPGFWLFWICKKDNPPLFNKDIKDDNKTYGGYIVLDGKGKRVNNVRRYYSNPNGKYRGRR